MDAKTIIALITLASGFISSLLFLSRKWNRVAFSVESMADGFAEFKTSVKKDIGDLELKIDKFDSKLFPEGRASFVYRDDCKGCRSEICDTVKAAVEDLKHEFIKRDDAKSEAHRTLHKRMDDQQKELIELRCLIDDGKKNV